MAGRGEAQDPVAVAKDPHCSIVKADVSINIAADQHRVGSDLKVEEWVVRVRFAERDFAARIEDRS